MTHSSMDFEPGISALINYKFKIPLNFSLTHFLTQKSKHNIIVKKFGVLYLVTEKINWNIFRFKILSFIKLLATRQLFY
jgi:hypothetical protein